MTTRAHRAALRCLIRLMLRPLFSQRMPIALQRLVLGAIGRSTHSPAGVVIEAGAGLAGERLVPQATRDGVLILYLHGGGYCAGSPALARPITTYLAQASGRVVHAPVYRLAPEHPYPAALNDAMAAYRALHGGKSRRRIVLAGDSAGAGLALATAIALRQARLPMPAALVLLSPWVDLRLRSDAVESNRHRDPLLTPEGLRRWAGLYAGRMPPEYPLCSPLLADLHGLPPTLIQAGGDSILLDDARLLHWRLAASGVESEFEEWPGLWHDFQLHAGLLDEADAALAKVADFLNRRLAAALRRAAAATASGRPLRAGRQTATGT